MGSFFFRAYRVISKNRWPALFFLSGITAASSLVVRNIEFDDDISSLIPATEETRRIKKVLKSIAFTDKIVVNIRKGEEGTVDDLTRYAAEFLDSVESRQGEFIKNIQGRVDTDAVPKTLDLVYRNLPLFLEESDYEAIQRKLSRDSIARITADNYRTLVSPTGIVAKKTILGDPLGLSFIALKKLRKLGFGGDFKLNDGFLLNNKEENILLFITPRFGSGETNKNLPFSDALYAVQDALNHKYDTRASSEYYGAALSAVSNARQIQKDIQFTVGIALILLLTLLIVFYRKWVLPLILFAPTLFGGLLAITFLILVRDQISAISLGIGAVLLGVTLDYALHILTHIRNGDSLESLFQKVAPSVLMSSLTTASAFLCLLFLDAQALQDLGIFAAISVLGASFFALLFIPQVYKGKRVKTAKRTFLDRWARFPFHKSKWALGSLTILLIIGIFTYPKVEFNQDISKLNYETEALLDARSRLEKLTDIGSKSLYLSTYGENFQQVLQRNDSLFEQLERLQDKGTILSFGSVGTLLQSDSTQRQKIKNWQRFWDGAKIDSLKKNLMQSGSELGFKPGTFDSFYALLEADFKPLQPSELAAIPSFSLDDYVVSDENGTTITSLIKVDESEAADLRERFGEVPNTLVIDRKNVNESFLGTLKRDFNRLLGHSLVVVILILFLFYRSFTLTLITSIPIFLTWFLTVGIMGLLHIEFNIFNIIICSFIFGLGVDYSIFTTNGLLTKYRTGEKTLATHKTSILLSVITTVAGVGVLVFAKHPVLYSVSVVSLIGIGCAVFVAFTFQPLLFRLFLGDTKKRPITPRVLILSLLSFAYFDLGGLALSVYSWMVIKLNPKASLKPQYVLHQVVSKFMKSVLYTNPFVSKRVIDPYKETFERSAMLIANHTSYLDILAVGMLHPKLIYLVKDHVYNSKTFGYAARLHGAYPVSGGIEGGEAYLRQKLGQGFSIVAFPEGSRSETNKINRFHKGAFYLAEQLHLDILPILIHGASEVSPKGSFIIRDGSITVKILPRITPDDARFPTSYPKRPKEIGTYFRSEFQRLRNQIEGKKYWHPLVLENYRHKGTALYKAVKKDLKAHAETYRNILEIVGKKERIVHLSIDYGQLDLLLALDSVDRKIHTYLEDKEARKLLKNNYLTQKYGRIDVMDSAKEALTRPAEILMIHREAFDLELPVGENLSQFQTLILLKGSRPEAMPHGFVASIENDTFILFKREELDI